MDQINEVGKGSIELLRVTVFLILVNLTFTPVDGQVFLQLEKANVPTVRKYAAGDKIYFMSTVYPKKWQSGRIVQILPEDNAVVFDDRITYLRDITHFKYYRPWPNAIGTNLMRFGVAWFVFAGIIEGGRATGVLDTQYKFGTDTAVIGASAILGGFLIKSVWAASVKKMNNRNRLRIIDIRL